MFIALAAKIVPLVVQSFSLYVYPHEYDVNREPSQQGSMIVTNVYDPLEVVVGDMADDKSGRYMRRKITIRRRTA